MGNVKGTVRFEKVCSSNENSNQMNAKHSVKSCCITNWNWQMISQIVYYLTLNCTAKDHRCLNVSEIKRNPESINKNPRRYTMFFVILQNDSYLFLVIDDQTLFFKIFVQCVDWIGIIVPLRQNDSKVIMIWC